MVSTEQSESTWVDEIVFGPNLEIDNIDLYYNYKSIEDNFEEYAAHVKKSIKKKRGADNNIHREKREKPKVKMVVKAIDIDTKNGTINNKKISLENLSEALGIDIKQATVFNSNAIDMN